MKLTYDFEKELLDKGNKIICGIDEAGRGPLAGAVWAAAVVLPLGFELEGLDDSKKLTEKKREELYSLIIENAIDYSIQKVEADVIDEINILQATFLAMTNACKEIKNCDFALIDGNKIPPQISVNAQAVVKGDGKSPSIAAASILAKVSRDREMLEYAEKFPDYFFDKHKGYGTKLHYEMLEKYGPCEIHRKSFLKKFYEKKR